MYAGQPPKAPADAAAASNVPVSSGAPPDGGLKCSPLKHDAFCSALLNAGQLHFVVHALLCAALPPWSFVMPDFSTRTVAARSQNHGLVDSCSSLDCHTAPEWRYLQSYRRLQGALRARHPLGMVMDAP